MTDSARQLGDKWYKFITYVLLPLNIVGLLVRILLLLNLDLPGVGVDIFLALLAIGLLSVILLGMHTKAKYAWYMIMVNYALFPVGFLIRMISTGYIREGNAVFAVMLTLVLSVSFAVPNLIYFYRRRVWFGIRDPFPNTILQSIRLPTTIKAIDVSGKMKEKRNGDPSVVSHGSGDDIPLEFYERAQSEIEKGEPVKGLWAKAFSEVLGDERKATAIYLRYRVQQLQNELITKGATDKQRQLKEATERADEERCRRESDQLVQRLQGDPEYQKQRGRGIRNVRLLAIIGTGLMIATVIGAHYPSMMTVAIVGIVIVIAAVLIVMMWA